MHNITLSIRWAWSYPPCVASIEASWYVGNSWYIWYKCQGNSDINTAYKASTHSSPTDILYYLNSLHGSWQTFCPNRMASLEHIRGLVLLTTIISLICQTLFYGAWRYCFFRMTLILPPRGQVYILHLYLSRRISCCKFKISGFPACFYDLQVWSYRQAEKRKTWQEETNWCSVLRFLCSCYQLHIGYRRLGTYWRLPSSTFRRTPRAIPSGTVYIRFSMRWSSLMCVIFLFILFCFV